MQHAGYRPLYGNYDHDEFEEIIKNKYSDDICTRRFILRINETYQSGNKYSTDDLVNEWSAAIQDYKLTTDLKIEKLNDINRQLIQELQDLQETIANNQNFQND